MKPATLLFGLIGLAVASPLIEERATNNYTGVLADLAVIKTDLAKLTKDIKAFMPNDVAGSITILQDSSTLENDINQATTDANNSAPFGKKGSNAIATAVLNLEKPIYASLNAIIAKKSAFQQGIFGVPLTPVVLNQLKTLKNDTDSLGAAITKKLDAALKGVAPGIIAQIDSHFDKAIAAYSS